MRKLSRFYRRVISNTLRVKVVVHRQNVKSSKRKYRKSTSTLVSKDSQNKFNGETSKHIIDRNHEIL